jgi:uncharacterized repeat protein (TIGR01451 family)
MRGLERVGVVFLVVALLGGVPAGSEQGVTAQEIRIEVLTEEGFQTLDYSIVGTVVPTIRISGPLPEGYRIFNDRPDGRAGVNGGLGGLGREITDRFAETAPGVVEGTLAFLYGANDIIITDGARIPNVLASVEMLNYTPDFEDVNGNGLLDREEDINFNGVLNEGEDKNGNGLLDHAEDVNANLQLDLDEDLNQNGVLDPGEDYNADDFINPLALAILAPLSYTDADITFDKTSGFSIHRSVVLLAFTDDASDVTMSRFLRENSLRPLGASFDFDDPTHLDIVTVLPPPGTAVLELIKSLNGVAPSDHFMPPDDRIPVRPPLELALPEILIKRHEAVSEDLPTRLIAGEPPPANAGNVGDAYNPATGGFDNNTAGAAGGRDLDELNIAWPHFFYDTFAAHRLVEHLTQRLASPVRPIVAVDGTGLGDGINLASLHLDLPPARIYKPTDTKEVGGKLTQATGALANIPDNPPPHDHETTVTLLAVGEGYRILGTGKHAAVMPIRSPSWTTTNAVYKLVASDPLVRVLNCSYGPDSFDSNGNGTIDGGEVATATKSLKAISRTLQTGIAALRFQSAREVSRDDDGDGRADEDPPGDQNPFGLDPPPPADPYPGMRGDDDGDGGIDFSDRELQAADYDNDGVPLAGPDGSSGAGPDGDFGFGPDGIRGTTDDAPSVAGPDNDPWDDNVPASWADNDWDDVVLGRNDDDEDGRMDEDPPNNGNKIVVLAAGNEGDPPNYAYDLVYGLSSPEAFDVPERGTRTRNTYPSQSSLFMAVSASGVVDPPTGPERAWEFSCIGSRVSVSAAGSEEVVAVQPDMRFQTSGGGTSWAAPQVAGLAGELLFLLDNVAGTDSMSPLQVVQLIEATADDLGTTAAVPPFRNDAPGNADDDRFGYGRINCWKAVLSLINGGLAEEMAYARAKSYGGVVFESLRDNWINEANTKWYGFKIITSVKGATVWIDGKQLEDKGASVPNAPAITAYAGVRSDRVIRIGIPFEDPTSGIVPVGNDGGEYIITFSIERADLIGDSLSASPTLSLRRPGQTAADAPFFNLELGADQLKLMRSNPQKIPGVVFDDFVFEITPADFGDATFAYPTDYKPQEKGYEGEGARHLNSNLEWLGKPARPQIQSVSPEQLPKSDVDPDGIPNVKNPPYDLDRYDDGVVFYPLTYLPGGRGIVEFTVCVADPDTDRYSRVLSRTLFVNAWIDWNTNGRWEENEEHVVDGLELDPGTIAWAIVNNRKPTTAVRLLAMSPAPTRPGWATFRAEFDIPPVIGAGELWARFRLDYRQDVGRTDEARFVRHYTLQLAQGPARFGEVEDYLIGTDFGDAPDVGSGRYPTRKSSAGARHLDIYKEWLQDSKTREPDACLKGSAVFADQDGYANLGNACDSEDRDVAEEASVLFDATSGWLYVSFTARSTIATRGYDLMGINDDGDKLIDEDPYKDGLDEDGDGKDGEDPPNLMEVTSLKPGTCLLDQKFNVWSTPPWSGGKGRYHATDVNDDRDARRDEDSIDGADDDRDGLIDEDPPGVKPLLVNVFVDWNGDHIWDTSTASLEWVVRDRRIAPETFGKDGQYTLGEPFEDENHNGVRDPGEKFTDSAGVESQSYSCQFHAPDGVDIPDRFWVRIRLAYAELSDGTIPDSGSVLSEKWIEAGIAHSTEDKRVMDREKGGALFGEVEDYPVTVVPVTKEPNVTVVPPGGEIDYTIVLVNPSENVIEGIRLVDELPSEVIFGSITQAPYGIAYNRANHAVEGTLDLPPLAETSITYTTEVPPTIPPYTPIVNCVTIETTTFKSKICSPEVTVQPIPVTGPPQGSYVDLIPKNVSDAARRLAWKGGQLGRTDPSQRWSAREDRPGEFCEPCGHIPMCVECMEWDLQAWEQRPKTIIDMMDLMAVLSYLREVSGQLEYYGMATIYWEAHWDGWHNRDRPR